MEVTPSSPLKSRGTPSWHEILLRNYCHFPARNSTDRIRWAPWKFKGRARFDLYTLWPPFPPFDRASCAPTCAPFPQSRLPWWNIYICTYICLSIERRFSKGGEEGMRWHENKSRREMDGGGERRGALVTRRRVSKHRRKIGERVWTTMR